MPRRNHLQRYQHDYYRHQDHYYQSDRMDLITGLVMFGGIVVIIISYFVFDTERKAELEKAESARNYEKILWTAVGDCSQKVVKFLMERNLVNIHRGSGERLLGYATEKECLEVVQLLVGEKVDINSSDLNHTTALHYAAKQGNLEIVKFLLQNDANPNAKEFREKTPRDLARGRVTVMSLNNKSSDKPYKEIIDLLYNAEKQYKPGQ